MPYRHILLDAKNCVYRAIYASKSGNDDPIIVFFRFINYYIRKYKCETAHFFWDCPSEEIWRKSIYTEYKSNRGSNEEIKNQLNRCTQIIKELIPCLNVRSYERDKQEADDLIYAFCRNKPKDTILIVSSDGDYKQVHYHNPRVDIYNPTNKMILEVEDKDPIDYKCFMGEKGDNITGYSGIGPKRAETLLNDIEHRCEFLKNNKDIYIRNRKLIDLSLCPELAENILYINEILAVDVLFDYDKIISIISKHKIRGMMTEVSNIIVPSFKFLNRGDTNGHTCS